MIKETYGQCILSGTNLKILDINVPKEFDIIINHIKGDLLVKGRFKGERAEDDCLAFNGNFDSILDFILLLKNSKVLTNNVDINLCLTVEYQGQCNFEMTADQIAKLFELKMVLGITCFPVEN